MLALVIALQRLLTSREGRLAPKGLRKKQSANAFAQGDLKGAIAACDKYPSTLGNSLRFIFEHVKAGREAVSQTAGDMAARDIRTTFVTHISFVSHSFPVAPYRFAGNSCRYDRSIWSGSIVW